MTCCSYRVRGCIAATGVCVCVCVCVHVCMCVYEYVCTYIAATVKTQNAAGGEVLEEMKA